MVEREDFRILLREHTEIILAALADSLNQEERFMADALETALTDITTAVGAAVTEIQTLAGEVAAGGTEPATVAASLETLAGNLNSAVTAATPAPAPAPAPAAVDPSAPNG